mmetsp:Transcript_26954/g.42758  ORF Transcript_26954/g.42758 Transcript_26954/m.42758 type:complete len:233 (+) Transcript_26954:238-936(+)
MMSPQLIHWHANKPSDVSTKPQTIHPFVSISSSICTSDASSSSPLGGSGKTTRFPSKPETASSPSSSLTETARSLSSSLTETARFCSPDKVTAIPKRETFRFSSSVTVPVTVGFFSSMVETLSGRFFSSALLTVTDRFFSPGVLLVTPETEGDVETGRLEPGGGDKEVAESWAIVLRIRTLHKANLCFARISSLSGLIRFCAEFRHPPVVGSYASIKVCANRALDSSYFTRR